MRNAIIASCLAIGLAGCVSVADKQDELVKICQTEPVVYAAFELVHASTPLPASTVEKARAAHAVITRICATPPKDNSEAIIVASRELANLLEARRTAEQRAE